MSNLSPYQSTKLYLFHKYDPLFNFYMAKDISDICHSRPNSKQVIDFNDFLRLDCQDEMLKRYYILNEVGRINLLAEYYSRNRVLENDPPALYLTTGGKAMGKRVKRRVKRQEQKREQDEDCMYEGQSIFLKSIDSDMLRGDQQQMDLMLDVSMETDVYDIYEEQPNNMSERKDTDRVEVWKGVFSLKENQDENQCEQSWPGELVLDFKALDHERILKEYNMLQTVNPQKIPIERIARKTAKNIQQQLTENKNITVLKKSEPKNRQHGKTYVVKGLPSTKKYIRLDEQYIEQIGIKKENRFIKGFKTEMEQGWRSPKTKSNHLRIYSPEQQPYSKFHHVKSKNKEGEYLMGSPSSKYNFYSKSPQIDEKMHKMQIISTESKCNIEFNLGRTQQYEALKQRAEEVEQQALRTIYRFSNKNIRSNEYISPSHR